MSLSLSGDRVLPPHEAGEKPSSPLWHAWGAKLNVNLFKARPIRSRVTLFTLIIFVSSMWAMAFYASRMLHQDMERLLSEQQASTVATVAAHVDGELDDRFRLLETFASGKTAQAILNDARAAQARLAESSAILSQFNAGLYVTNVRGVVIASIPVSPERVGINYMGTDHVAAALREGKASVSSPVMGTALNAALISMAVPIRNSQDIVIGALVGVTDLSKPNFLDKITQNRYGHTGNYQLEDPNSRYIITGTDKSTIMQALPPFGVNWLNDQHVQGLEKTGVTATAQGVEVLASGKRIPRSGWIMVASLPTQEAFAPIRDMQRRMVMATIILTLLAGGLTWWMLRRQLAPLQATARTLASLSESDQLLHPIPVVRQDEIGQVISGFYRLVAELSQRQEELRQSEERYRTVTEWTPEPLAVHHNDKLVYVNPATVKMLGCASAQDLLGKSIFDLVHPDCREELFTSTKNCIELGLPSRMRQTRFLKLDGAAIDVELQGVPIVYNGVPARQVAMRDITERKKAEELVHQLAYHDPLTHLANRLLLKNRLTQVMLAGKRYGRYSALILLDLDNFKELNDTHGHGAGDSLLVETSRRLRSCIREIDTVARFGGDEFVVLLDGLSADRAQAQSQASQLAGKIRYVLADPYLLPLTTDSAHATQSIEHCCTASIGVVLFLGLENSEEDVLKWADIAMYQAKAAGRNTVRLYA